MLSAYSVSFFNALCSFQENEEIVLSSAQPYYSVTFPSVDGLKYWFDLSKIIFKEVTSQKSAD